MFRTLSENFALKVIALGASVLIWLYVGGEQNPNTTRVVNAEVRARGVAPEKLLVRIGSDPIAVEISGPRSEVDSIADNEIKAVVDLGQAQPGERQLRVTEWQRPRRTPSISLRPMRQFIDADIRPKVRKSFPITASFNNDPPSGRVYGLPRLTPARADVVGAKEDVQRVQRLAVYVETRGGSVRVDAPVKALDADGVMVDSVTTEPPSTHVEIDLTDAPASRTLPVAVQFGGRPTPPYTVAEVSVTPPIVTVSGKPEQIVQLKNVPTGPVSLDTLTGDTTIEVPIVLPDGVTVRNSAGIVRVTIRIRDASRPNP